ncbi:MAG: hypothetical protein VKN33_02840 [Candidatus Sericytochromatia bacterium]|nr:hypothetical protein [Candidatus Sericytochromatia bacterium]
MRYFCATLLICSLPTGVAAATPSSPPAPPPPPLVTHQAADALMSPAWMSDLLMTAGSSSALWVFLSYSGNLLSNASPQTSAMLSSLAVASAVFLPAGLMTATKGTAFPLDDFIAATTGGLLGIGAAYSAARWLGAGQPLAPLPYGLLLGGGQALGTTLVYHGYRQNKPRLTNLNQLPLRRDDDPIEDWRYWLERRAP